ncbi:CAP-Gly domain-containing linker protein 4 [Mortierella sp. AD010]|nr:CAP-Gly domain-containing linker protein 4 [Mortierella sp. AD010]
MAPKTPTANSKLPKPPSAGSSIPQSGIPAAPNVLQRRTFMPAPSGNSVSKALKDMTPEQQALLAEAISMHSPGLIDPTRKVTPVTTPVTTPTLSAVSTSTPTAKTTGSPIGTAHSENHILGFSNHQPGSPSSNLDRASPTGLTSPISYKPTTQIGRRLSSNSSLPSANSNSTQQFSRPISQNGFSPLSTSQPNLARMSSTPSPTGPSGTSRPPSGSPSGSRPALSTSRHSMGPVLGTPAFGTATGARTSLMKQPLFQRPPGTAVPATKNQLAAIPGSPGVAPPSLDNYEIGDRVVVESMALSGHLRFLGPTEFKSGTWAGIELDTPTGKNDGSVGDVVYFQCRPKYGIFVLAAKIAKPELLFPSSPELADGQEEAPATQAPPAPSAPPAQLTSHAAQAASKISAGSRASKYIGMTATQLKQRNVLPQPASSTTPAALTTSRITTTQSHLPGSSVRAPSPTVKALGSVTGSPTTPRTMGPVSTNGRANSPSPVPKQVLRSSSPTTRPAGSRLSQPGVKPTLATLNSKPSAHSRSTSSTSSVTSQSSATGSKARTSPTPRAVTTPRRLSSRSETPDINNLISPSESRSNLLDQATTIQMSGSPKDNLSLQLQQLQLNLETAVAENNLLKSEVSETKSQLEINKMLEKKDLSYEERTFLSKSLGREAIDERLAQELEELHLMKTSWDKEKAAKDQEIKVVTDKMTQAWLDAARSQKERTALIQEKNDLTEKLRQLEEGGAADVNGEGVSVSRDQQDLIEALQKSLQEANDKALVLESKVQDLSAKAIEEEEKLNRVNEDMRAASEAKCAELELERDGLQVRLAELEVASQAKLDEVGSRLKELQDEASAAKDQLVDTQNKLNEETESRRRGESATEDKLKLFETELQESQNLLAKSEKLARGFEEKAKEQEALVAKRDQDIANLKLELQDIAGMVQSEEVDRMRKVWEIEKKRLEEAIADNITVMTGLRNEIQTLESNEEELQEKIKALEASQVALTDLKTAADLEVAQLQKSLKDTEEAFALERSALEGKITESESVLETRLSETKERMDELEMIAMSVEEWRERCEAMQLEMIQKTAAVEDLGLKLADAQAQEEALLQETDKLKKELEEKAAAVEATAIESSRVEVAALEEEREQLLVKISELEAALTLSVSAPRATSSGPADSEGVLNRTELEEEIAALKQMVHELTAENAAVASDNKKLMQEHDILMEAHKHVETECLKLMDEVERLHSESLAVTSLGESEVTDKVDLSLVHHETGTKTLIGQEELKAALNNVTVLTKDTSILAPSEKQSGQNQSATVIRLEGLLKDKQAMLDRLTQAHSLEMRDLRQRYVELDRSKAWEITQLNKELTDLESLIESKIFHEADLEEEVQLKQKQIDRLQQEISELKSQLAKYSNGSSSYGSTSGLPPSGLSSDRRANPSYSALSGSNGVSKSPLSGDRTRSFTNNTDKALFCEVCEVEGHDLVSCVAVFGDSKTLEKSAAHASAPVFSEAEMEDDRPYCENCEEFGLHYTDECPNESLTY